jgi:hypothetical protein
MIDWGTYVRSRPWVEAVGTAQNSGDLEPLARVLRSDVPMEKAARCPVGGTV